MARTKIYQVDENNVGSWVYIDSTLVPIISSGDVTYSDNTTYASGSMGYEMAAMKALLGELDTLVGGSD